MATTVNAAIAGLVAQITAGTDPTEVTVTDGPPVEAVETDWVAIGYQPGRTEAVDVTYDWAQIGAMRSEERYDVLCSLLARWSGDDDIPALRARAMTVRDQVAAAIRSDQTLGRAVRVAHISSSTLHQVASKAGYEVGFNFTVTCTARIDT